MAAVATPATATPVTLAPAPKSEIPLPHREIEVDPFRELREMTEAVRADCRNAPEEYLDEVRVAGGGE